MRLKIISALTCLLLPLLAAAQSGEMYKWTDDEGIVHFGDSIPAEYADKQKDVINDQGVIVGHIQGKKTDEELAAEKQAKELQTQIDLQNRADRALLATYATVEEIEMHRDRRVELFQAQARVTELYLRNLDRRLNLLKREAGAYKPYSSDPNAPTIEPALIRDIEETEEAISRHKDNLKGYQSRERQIIERFDGDIQRFVVLKGLTLAQFDPE
jgi:hypothetical protein